MSCLHPSVFTLDQIVSIFRLITHITSCYKLNAITGMKKTSILLNSCYLLSLLDKIFRLRAQRWEWFWAWSRRKFTFVLTSYHTLYLRLLDWKIVELRTDPKLMPQALKLKQAMFRDKKGYNRWSVKTWPQGSELFSVY